MPLRRKKWTEEEERTLIDKYAEMLSDGALARMKTREKKFGPIAAQVNLMHHAQDPISFPWQWSWKDASTKVQNMRHQYMGVKQKIKKQIMGANGEQQEVFDWVEGLTHWPNFLRYKDVFGDVALEFNESSMTTTTTASTMMAGRRVAVDSPHIVNELIRNLGMDEGNGVLGLGLGFDYEGEEGEDDLKEDGDGFEFEEVIEPVVDDLRKKRRRVVKGEGGMGLEQRIWCFLRNQFAQLREREARLEERAAGRERERQKMKLAELEEERDRSLEEWEKKREEREHTRGNKLREERFREWETMEKESAEREKRRREEDLVWEREWEERMERRRFEWKKRIDDMLREHRIAVDQLQTRILQDQHNVMNQLLGLLPQWTGHSTGLSDHTSTGNPYLSQMVQNLHHVNGIVPGENRVEGDNHGDQFIVDG